MLDNEGYKHTLRIYNTYCFSTVTMVTSTLLNVKSTLSALYITLSIIYIKTESNKPKKCKLVLQKFLYENSFYSLNEYFELQKVKYICIWSGFVFESLAHEVDMHACSFFYVLICILYLFVYITQLLQCINLCLLRSNVLNYFIVH